MKKTFLVSLFFGVSLFAQTTPNCNLNSQQLFAAAPGSSYNNTTLKCSIWKLNYFSEGFTVISIQLEGAPDVSGAPGAWSIISTTITNGTNPLTSTVSGTLSANAYFPWMRANLTVATGTGTVNYSLIGNAYVGDSSSASSSSGGTTSTVNGPDAPGVAPTKNPVQDSGVDSAGLVRRLNTTPQAAGAGAGSLVVAGTQPIGGTPSDNPVLVGGVDGTPVVRRFLVDGTGHAVVGFNNQGSAALDGVSNSNVDPPNTTGANAPLLVAQDFNGVTWDRQRSASLANQYPADGTVVPSIGAAQNEKGARWSKFSNPAVSTQATVSQAAVAATRHVVDCIGFSAASTTAPALTALTINVRDGATGAGTIIWTYQVVISAGTGQNVNPFDLCGLNLAGTTNTAMTIEFSALLTNLIESVSISGYDVI